MNANYVSGTLVGMQDPVVNKAEACSFRVYIVAGEKDNKKIVMYQCIESVVEGDTEVL